MYFFYWKMINLSKKKLNGTHLKVYLPSILKNLDKPMVILKAIVYNYQINKQIKPTKNKTRFYN